MHTESNSYEDSDVPIPWKKRVEQQFLSFKNSSAQLMHIESNSQSVREIDSDVILHIETTLNNNSWDWFRCIPPWRNFGWATILELSTSSCSFEFYNQLKKACIQFLQHKGMRRIQKAAKKLLVLDQQGLSVIFCKILNINPKPQNPEATSRTPK